MSGFREIVEGCGLLFGLPLVLLLTASLALLTHRISRARGKRFDFADGIQRALRLVRRGRSTVQVSRSDPIPLRALWHAVEGESPAKAFEVELLLRSEEDRRPDRLLDSITSGIYAAGPLLGLLGTVWGMRGVLLTVNEETMTTGFLLDTSHLAVALSTTILGGLPALVALATAKLFSMREIWEAEERFADAIRGIVGGHERVVVRRASWAAPEPNKPLAPSEKPSEETTNPVMQAT